MNYVIENKDILNPKIWNEDKTLKDKVKNKIKIITNLFLDKLDDDEITYELLDIVLVGSNCSYNYNDKSDLDIHFIFKDNNINSHIYQQYINNWNNNNDIKFFGINIELYVEVVDDVDTYTNKSNGIYSINKDKWIKEPVKESSIEIDEDKFENEYEKFAQIYNDINNNPSKDNIDKFLDDIYKLRQDSLNTSGEFGIGNLLFKALRYNNIIQDLKSKKRDIINKELSLEGLKKLNEDNNEENNNKEDEHTKMEQHINSLCKGINGTTNKYYCILAFSTDDRPVKNKDNYENAKKEVLNHNPIKIEGYWNGQKQDESFILDISNINTYKQLSYNLEQLQFIVFKFNTPYEFTAYLYEKTARTYKIIRKTSLMKAEDNLDVSDFYSQLSNGFKFSFNLYGPEWNINVLNCIDK